MTFMNDVACDERTPVHCEASALRWDLRQALAWIGTRRTDAVAVAHECELTAWINDHPGDYPFSSRQEAWNALAEAMINGVTALATCRFRARFRRGRSYTEQNVSFPPVGKPQLCLVYAPIDNGAEIVLRAQDEGSTYFEAEYVDLMFQRTALIALFPNRADSSDRASAQVGSIHTASGNNLEPNFREKEVPSIQSTVRASFSREQIIGAAEAARLLNISVSHFRRQYQAGRVPAPINVTQRKLGWHAGELFDWLDERPRR